MMMRLLRSSAAPRVLAVLRGINLVAGLGVIVYGVFRWVAHGNVPAGLIALAVLVVGPLEDALKRKVHTAMGLVPATAVELVDQATSAVFLVLLFLALLLL